MPNPFEDPESGVDNMDDAAQSVNTDMENGLWEETPETNYFKMMMQDNQMGRVVAGSNDNMDDSVVGGATLASMMGGRDNKNTKKYGTTTTTTSVDQFSLPNDSAVPPPAETMSIVGIEDDVSTIANDTVNETTKAFFTSHGTKGASQPRIRLFKEYNTPEKHRKNKKSESSTEDDETAPETPPGMIRVPGRQSSTKNLAQEQEQQGQERPKESAKAAKVSRSKRVYIVAGALAVILFASIIALGVALAGMRDSDESSSPSYTMEDGDTDLFDIWPDLDAPMDESPTTESPAGSPSQGPADQGESTPTNKPPDTPSGGEDTGAAYEELLSLLLGRGIVSPDIENDPDTPQYQSLVWLSRDPNYDDYTEDRVIQRYALAVLAHSTGAAEQLSSRERKRRGLLDGWLEYSDECTWYTSSSSDVCDESGRYVTIDIQDWNLGGSLPPELALLSDSLRNLVLNGNRLRSFIPPELGSLSLLETLRLSQNRFDGRIATHLGLLNNLEILDLGFNQLTGTIATEVAGLQSLVVLNLNNNELRGTIPPEISNLGDTLVHLALNDNSLTGDIPNEITDLNNLQTLTLGNNDFDGDMPRNICRLRELEVLSLDCEAQGCQCCTECAEESTTEVTSEPTSVPTRAATGEPTGAPVAAPVPITAAPTVPPMTDSPTVPPATAAPTDKPTQCMTGIQSRSSCYERGADIEISFSNCDPQDDDWVGLYSASEDFSNLPNPPIWSWACGTRNCRDAVNSMRMPLNEMHASNNAWPLREGTYVVILARNSAQPYTAFAVSSEFTIQDTC